MNKTLLAFNFRGTFGSGKSVVPSMYVKDTEEAEAELVFQHPSSKKILYTVLHKHKLVIVGGYKTDCGGIDTFVPFTTAVDAIHDAAQRAKELEYDLIMEGVILSSTLSGSLKIYRHLEENGFTVVPIYMGTSSEQCVENVRKRNGGKPLKQLHSITSKHHHVWDNQKPKMEAQRKVWVFKTRDVDTVGMYKRFRSLRAKLHKEVPNEDKS